MKQLGNYITSRPHWVYTIWYGYFVRRRWFISETRNVITNLNIYSIAEYFITEQMKKLWKLYYKQALHYFVRTICQEKMKRRDEEYLSLTDADLWRHTKRSLREMKRILGEKSDIYGPEEKNSLSLMCYAFLCF